MLHLLSKLTQDLSLVISVKWKSCDLYLLPHPRTPKQYFSLKYYILCFLKQIISLVKGFLEIDSSRIRRLAVKRYYLCTYLKCVLILLKFTHERFGFWKKANWTKFSSSLLYSWYYKEGSKWIELHNGRGQGEKVVWFTFINSISVHNILISFGFSKYCRILF